MNPHGAHPLFGVFGIIAFVLSLYLVQRRITRWRKAEGFAPAPSIHRAGNREYKKLLWRNMPAGLKQEIRIVQAVGFVFFVIGILLAA
jgi:hypothetical protein